MCTSDVVRVTLSLTTAIDHVHCYLVRCERNGWILVDTGLATSDVERLWQTVLSGLDGPLLAIFVTHFHPDHLGGAADLAALTGAPVLQGKCDLDQAIRAWATDAPEIMRDYLILHGMPPDDADNVRTEDIELGHLVRFSSSPELVEPGDDVYGWDVLHLPGHADGHLALVRDRVLIGGDVLLENITPVIGRYPHSVADPLELYLASLETLEALPLQVIFAGHEETIRDPARRARDVRRHHASRLASVAVAIRAAPRTAYEVSLDLFPARLSPSERRFAIAEVVAHAERLVSEGCATRLPRTTGIQYVSANPA